MLLRALLCMGSGTPSRAIALRVQGLGFRALALRLNQGDARRGQRYLLGCAARPPGWRAVLQRVPGQGGGSGGLALVLREDARPEDVLTGVLQVRWALAQTKGAAR